MSSSQRATLLLSHLSHFIMISAITPFHLHTRKPLNCSLCHSTPLCYTHTRTHTLHLSPRDRVEPHFHWDVTACSMHDQPCHYLSAEIIWVSDVSSGSADYSLMVVDCGLQTGVIVGLLNIVPGWKLQWRWERSDQENEACDLWLHRSAF